ncbi:NAD(P)-dependent oxidoreductase [Kitasatospora sp. NBC_01250]|uniref:NAD(P)-dependent oxidoreductase n=1 Tax=unclassified Kitasatospora TaxID=2633591 RepID=UPI002E121A1C|nr:MULTISPECIES: NAD(P)-dependent oxidoreductase [unclassified Kitasatospora]WSJ71254.1 NAD(P)-dependent oxidoreductase [Kitasatospora sp. NBC_01302]
MRIGFAGLGTMGGGMSRRLAEAGFAVTVFDLDTAAAERLAGQSGITAAARAADLAAPVVITMLPDGAAVRAVAEQLLEAMTPGSLLVDTGSSDPRDTRELRELAARHGVHVVDAPVSGSPAAARSGELTLMAAGDTEALDLAEPVLAALGRVYRVGPSGAGHALKALNNLLSSVSLAATAEVLLAGKAFGLAPDVMLEVVNASTGRNHASETKLPAHVLTGTFDSGFAQRLMLKDIRIADRLMAEVGGPAELSRACRGIWEQAHAQLPDGADNVEVVRWLESEAGRELRA